MFDELYQEILLEHYRHPRNAASLEEISDEYLHENPTCGDSVKVEISVTNNTVSSIRHDTKGCAICTASVSLMSEYLSGKALSRVKQEIDTFISIMRGGVDIMALQEFGDSICLAGVAKMPVRVKCATLGWHALRERIEREEHAVSSARLPDSGGIDL